MAAAFVLTVKTLRIPEMHPADGLGKQCGFPRQHHQMQAIKRLRFIDKNLL
jgi:hypothetical protein